MYVRCIDGKNLLLITEKIADASFFFIETTAKPGEFHIVHYMEKNVGEVKSSISLPVNAQHKFFGIVTKNLDLTGREKGPLQIGGGRAANFTLRHAQQHKEFERLDIAEWEKDAYFVSLAPRKTQHSSYLSVDEKRDCSTRVSSREVKFQLLRVHNDEGYIGTVYRAQEVTGNNPLPLHPPSYDDSDDADFDFDYEFGQVAAGF